MEPDNTMPISTNQYKNEDIKYKTTPKWYIHASSQFGTTNLEYKIIHGALTSKQEAKFKAQITVQWGTFPTKCPYPSL